MSTSRIRLSTLFRLRTLNKAINNSKSQCLYHWMRDSNGEVWIHWNFI